VSGEGTFHWEWAAPDDSPPSEVMVYDITRTSTAVFTQISSMDEGIYRCTATYDPVLPNIYINQSDSLDIEVQLQCKGIEYI
jgi:hypothetical protein